ncbi:MAG: hypothetical protein Q8R30_00330 [bacterium]|nr:hypothetical protein [bacterium]MDZ4286028.1 hypothetical protein [Candidatus Sungbacteria bacterium]
MSRVADQFSCLAASLIKQAKQDLTSEDDYLAVRAALYFFLDPAPCDNDDLKRFAGLCAATKINAEAAAKSIFNELSACQQNRIRSLLRNAGYSVK